MLVMLHEEEGHEVEAATHGQAALTLVEKLTPDLLTTDFMMPLMTGLELAQKIRSDPALRTLPILLLSGAQGSIARHRPDLFDRVLNKPYRIHDPLDALEAMLRAD